MYDWHKVKNKSMIYAIYKSASFIFTFWEEKAIMLIYSKWSFINFFCLAIFFFTVKQSGNN